MWGTVRFPEGSLGHQQVSGKAHNFWFGKDGVIGWKPGTGDALKYPSLPELRSFMFSIAFLSYLWLLPAVHRNIAVGQTEQYYKL